MNGVNKVILIGHVGQEPEIRALPNGEHVVSLSVATSESWKDRQTGEKKEKTEWHRLVFFGQLSDIIGEYVHKGSRIYVEGKLQTRKWQAKDGTDRFTTEIIGNQIQLLDRHQDHTPTDEKNTPSAGDEPGWDEEVPF